jgi:hypothetical protein
MSVTCDAEAQDLGTARFRESSNYLLIGLSGLSGTGLASANRMTPRLLILVVFSFVALVVIQFAQAESREANGYASGQQTSSAE